MGTWRMDNPEGSLAMVTTEGARTGGWSCDEVCTSHGETCSQTSLDSLNGDDTRETAADCVTWGAPYIHNSHIDTPLCWGGSNPSVAPCGQTPSDANHRRLCPCEASVEEMDFDQLVAIPKPQKISGAQLVEANNVKAKEVEAELATERTRRISVQRKLHQVSRSKAAVNVNSCHRAYKTCTLLGMPGSSCAEMKEACLE